MNDISTYLGDIYARTLFALADESKTTTDVKNDLDAFWGVVAGEKDFAALIASPCFYTDYKEQLVGRVFSGRLSELTMNFLMVVIRHDRAKFLSQIISKYNELWEDRQGCRSVKATVSRAMNEDEIVKLSLDIAAAMSRKVRLDVAVDPSIVGGIIIRYSDKVVDNTVKSRLQRAVNAITSGEKRRVRINEV